MMSSRPSHLNSDHNGDHNERGHNYALALFYDDQREQTQSTACRQQRFSAIRKCHVCGDRGLSTRELEDAAGFRRRRRSQVQLFFFFFDFDGTLQLQQSVPLWPRPVSPRHLCITARLPPALRTVTAGPPAPFAAAE